MFDITKAAGYGKVSKLDTQEIVRIPLDRLHKNDKNFFDVSDVQALKESIQVKGVLQPLLVVRDGEDYRIIAGHRRFKALYELSKVDKDQFSTAPCVILPPMSESIETFTLIQTNTTARQLTPWEKLEAVSRMRKALVVMKAEGVKLPGSMRAIVEEQLKINKTEQGRLKVVDENLAPEWKKELKARNITSSCAYELARLPADDQAELLAMKQSGEISCMCAYEVGKYKDKKRAKPWLRAVCKFADGVWPSELREAGKTIPCRFFRDVLRHKDKGHPEKCCGCCGECADALICVDACMYGQAHAREQTRAKTVETAKQQPAPAPAPAPAPEEAPEPTPAEPASPKHVPAPTWVRLSDQPPEDGQRVVVFKTIGALRLYSEAVYRAGEWYFPDMDDFKLNLEFVEAWTTPPEEAV